MTKQKTIVFALALFLIGSTGALLSKLRTFQRLGQPAVKTSPLPDSNRLQIQLPEQVLDYKSESLPVEPIELAILPKDTSFGRKLYTAPDKFWTSVSVVLMGTDRTSLHKPQICFGGQGWIIDENVSRETTVHFDKPSPYDLPVMKLIANKQVRTPDGAQFTARQLFVYWFVAPNQYTAKHWQRMWWMARDLFRTGVLNRWAYVSCSSICLPGQEDATFERIKKFMNAAVPEFQLTPAPAPIASAR